MFTVVQYILYNVCFTKYKSTANYMPRLSVQIERSFYITLRLKRIAPVDVDDKMSRKIVLGFLFLFFYYRSTSVAWMKQTLVDYLSKNWVNVGTPPAITGINQTRRT